jgi:hypothetical protein
MDEIQPTQDSKEAKKRSLAHYMRRREPGEFLQNAIW